MKIIKYLIIPILLVTTTCGDKDSHQHSRTANTPGEKPATSKEVISKCIRDLSDKDYSIRMNSVKKLGQMKAAENEVVPVLIQVAKNNNEDKFIRSAAVKSLGNLGPVAAIQGVPALIEVLKDKDYFIRDDVIRVLGEFGPMAEAAIPRLLETMKMEDQHSNSVVETLGKIGAAAVPQLIALVCDSDEYWNSLDSKVCKTLSGIGEPIIIPLQEKMRDENKNVRRKAASILGSTPAALTYLINGLKAKDVFIRRGSARGLGHVSPPPRESIPPLIQALKDEDAVVRMNAAGALSRVNHVFRKGEYLTQNDLKLLQAARETGNTDPAAKMAVPPLIEALGDKDPGVRKQVIFALGEIGAAAKDAVPGLIRALFTPDKSVQIAAIEALGRMGPTANDSVPALIKLLEKNPAKYSRIARWDERLRTKVYEYLPFSNPTRESIIETLVNIGPIAAGLSVPALVKDMISDSGFYNRDVIDALGKFGPAARAGVPALIRALKSRNSTIRSCAAHSLGNIGSGARQAVPALVKALEDPVSLVAAHAEGALEKINKSKKNKKERKRGQANKPNKPRL